MAALASLCDGYVAALPTKSVVSRHIHSGCSLLQLLLLLGPSENHEAIQHTHFGWRRRRGRGSWRSGRCCLFRLLLLLLLSCLHLQPALS